MGFGHKHQAYQRRSGYSCGKPGVSAGYLRKLAPQHTIWAIWHISTRSDATCRAGRPFLFVLVFVFPSVASSLLLEPSAFSSVSALKSEILKFEILFEFPSLLLLRLHLLRQLIKVPLQHGVVASRHEAVVDRALGALGGSFDDLLNFAA
jgi:hypothetical protein